MPKDSEITMMEKLQREEARQKRAEVEQKFREGLERLKSLVQEYEFFTESEINIIIKLPTPLFAKIMTLLKQAKARH
jgi:hypothetical protein